jgi:hypothetical protein
MKGQVLRRMSTAPAGVRTPLLRTLLVLAAGALIASSAPATAMAHPDVPVAHAAKSDPNAYASSDKSGRDCSPKHVIFVSLDIGGQHWGKGRKYIDLQVVGKVRTGERPFYAKTKSKQFVVCSVQRVIYDRILSGKYVNPAYKTYYPRRPELSMKGTVPPSSNKRVSLISFGRFKAKRATRSTVRSNTGWVWAEPPFAQPPGKLSPGPAVWIKSDKSGKDCSVRHAIYVSLLVGGMHTGKGRKYMDLQVVGRPSQDEDLPFYAKSKKKDFVICSVQRVIFDRYYNGQMVNAVYANYYPRKPGLSVKGSIPPFGNQEVTLVALGRYKKTKG